MFHGLDSFEVIMDKPVKLTSAHIERLKGGALADREVPSLSVDVAAHERKQRRFKRLGAGTKKTVELILGAHPAFSIDEAREWAASLSRVKMVWLLRRLGTPLGCVPNPES